MPPANRCQKFTSCRVICVETYSRCRVRKLRASKEPPSDSQPSSRDRPSSRTRSPHTQLSSRAPAMDNRQSYRAPAPDSRPPPVPGVSQCWTTQGDVYTESERIYHTAGHYGTYTTSGMESVHYGKCIIT